MSKDPQPDILKRIDRRSGMTVPEGYFEDFSTRMLTSLPERKVEEPDNILPAPKRFWVKVRPYAYMAAMFAGVWLMMWVFNDFASRALPQMSDNPVIAEVLGTDMFYDYYEPDINEYDLLEDLYDEGADAGSFTLTNYNDMQ